MCEVREYPFAPAKGSSSIHGWSESVNVDKFCFYFFGCLQVKVEVG
jgi:hypothetical protein